MFSQFRQAVEGFAQPQPRRSQDFNTSGESIEDHRLASGSHDARRTYAPQRPASPLSRSSSPGPSSISKSNSALDPGLRKFTLEERLRASFTVGEASNTTTPAISSRASSVSNAVPVTQHPLSPTSVPLPGSPALSAAASPLQVSDMQGSSPPQEDPPAFSLAINHPQDSNDEVSHTPSSSEVPKAPTDIPLPLSPQEELAPDDFDGLVIPISASTGTDIKFQLPDNPPADGDAVRVSGVRRDSGDVSGEADPSNSVNVDASDGHGRRDTPPVSSLKCSEIDVEALQERLRLVEQRFSGMSQPTR